jgi:hypothetical protein
MKDSAISMKLIDFHAPVIPLFESVQDFQNTCSDSTFMLAPVQVTTF